ncbi:MULTISPECIES: PG0870-related protein [Bacteroides]|nr:MULTISPECIES: PG0870-related protein [Bacteroides]MDA3621417.1 PG0870-related protein [Bacteroides sp. 47]
MCSQCGRARCFTYYVNENGQPFDKSVGRCDHESGCGYHYPTKEYFKDNPDKNMKLC